MDSSETYCCRLNNSDKVFFTYTIRNLAILVMKIMSLKTKVRHKHSLSQFQLEWCNKLAEEAQAEKHLRAPEQARGAGLQPGRTGWSLHSRRVMIDSPAETLCQPASPDSIPVLQHTTLSLVGSSTVSSADCSLENLHTSTPTRLYLPTVSGNGVCSKVPSSYTCYYNCIVLYLFCILRFHFIIM